MPTPIVFRKPQQTIQSFSFADVATGKGILTLYPVSTKADATQEYSLTGFVTDGQPDTISGSTSSASFVKVADIDFDLDLGKTIRIDGDVLAAFGVQVSDTGGGSSTMYTVTKLRKWDGSTETDLGEVQSAEFSDAATSDARRAVKIAVSNKRVLGSETLRVTCEIWALNTGGATTTAEVGVDPTNGTAFATNSSSKAFTVRVPIIL